MGGENKKKLEKEFLILTNKTNIKKFNIKEIPSLC